MSLRRIQHKWAVATRDLIFYYTFTVCQSVWVYWLLCGVVDQRSCRVYGGGDCLTEIGNFGGGYGYVTNGKFVALQCENV